MVEAGMEVLIIKVASMGLRPSKHLGMRLEEVYPEMKRLVKLPSLSLFISNRNKSIIPMFAVKEENLRV